MVAHFLGHESRRLLVSHPCPRKWEGTSLFLSGPSGVEAFEVKEEARVSRLGKVKAEGFYDNFVDSSQL